MAENQLGGNQYMVLPEGASRLLGKEAQRTNIAVGYAVASIVKTTLGPKGMDKMLVSELGDIVITNDGATILEEMNVEHPVAKILVEVAKTQDKEVGDGTTTAVIHRGRPAEECRQPSRPGNTSSGHNKGVRHGKGEGDGGAKGGIKRRFDIKDCDKLREDSEDIDRFKEHRQPQRQRSTL